MKCFTDCMGEKKYTDFYSGTLFSVCVGGQCKKKKNGVTGDMRQELFCS